MIPISFEYKKAGTVDEAIQMLQDEGAHVLAGGHSLIPALKLRLNMAGSLVDISKIADLRYIRVDGGNLCVGAASTHADIQRSSDVASNLPILAQTASVIGDPQVRNMGTIGGSIAHADPAADWPAALLACGATINIKGSGGSRSIAAADFFQDIYETALGEGEIITEIQFPIPAAGSGMSYQKFMQPASRFALVGCAAIISVSGGNITAAQVAFTGVSNCAFRDAGVEAALVGQPANAATAAAAAAKAAANADANSDHFASEEYRKHLATVYAKRAIMAAMG